MTTLPEPPKKYADFIERFPHLGQAWESIHEAGRQGSFDERTARLVKLGVAMGAMRQGSVHAGIRKALAMGITREEIDQVVALAAGALGMPSTVAVFSWVEDVVGTSE